MKSERINLLVTPEEKALIDQRAKQAGLTTSELVRRAVVAFDSDADMDELRAIADALAGLAERLERKLAANLDDIAALREQLADKDALRAAAMAELEASGDVWPFDLPDRADPGKGSTA